VLDRRSRAKPIRRAFQPFSNHLHKLISTGLVKQERWPIVCRANYWAIDSLLGYLIDECSANVTATILAGDHNSFGKWDGAPRDLHDVNSSR
jgi:hypothetical protein